MDEDHFQGKNAQAHVEEVRNIGSVFASEKHGAELAGSLFAFLDSAKETAIVFFLLLLFFCHSTSSPFLPLLFGCGWALWKGGRSALLGWARLERLHRILVQEKFEIDHHRGQEREELTELYKTKGFHGKLLEEVIDTLMADPERLLRVMVEEELKLPLENQEHPLKQGLCAALGALFVSFSLFFAWFYLGYTAAYFVTTLFFLGCSGIQAYKENNHLLPALVWHSGLFALFWGILHFLSVYIV